MTTTPISETPRSFPTTVLERSWRGTMREARPERMPEPPERGLLAGPLAAVCAGLIALSAVSLMLNNESRQMHGVSLVWLPNALLIGVVLCTRPRQWWAYIGLGYVVDLLVNLTVGSPLGQCVFFSLCNTVEVVVACCAMAPVLKDKPDLRHGRHVASFLICGVFAAPALASWMAAWFLHRGSGVPILHAMRFWFAADALGIAMLTPLYLSFRHQTRSRTRSWGEVAGLFLLMGVISFLVFRFTSYPTLWMVLLGLLLLGVRLGFRGSSIGLLMVTYIGGYLTMEGFGPLQPTSGIPLTSRIEFFQMFLVVSMLALYVTESAMAASRRVMTKLTSSEIRFRSLAEASRDVIVLVDLRGHRRYVSPAMTELLGWSSEQLVDKTFGELAHPEDEAKVAHMLDELWAGKQAAPLEYRCRKKDRSYLWMEATARLLHDGQSGEASGFVFVLRDIAERKAAEEALKEAFAKVEALALQDGLTGVANRRLLDQTLEQEWLRGVRDQAPLSVVLIDVDHFKKFNDMYGHLAGDACLRRVAQSVQAVLRRPPDLLARYGGEEFVAVLPNTPGEGAGTVAEVLRRTVERCAVPHEKNEVGVVTISLGCATVVPTSGGSVSSLLKAADEALYEAKKGGRNQVRVARGELVLR